MAVKPAHLGKAGKRVLNDKFFKQAKSEGYLARSAFKLQELQQKHKLIAHGSRVLDLGCSPGAWLQVACKCLGPKSRGGHVLGIDIQDVVLPKEHCDDRVEILQADARTLDIHELYAKYEGFHVVLSDMCHSTMGSSSADVLRSLDLASCAAELAVGSLEATSMQQLPKVYNPMPEASQDSPHEAQQQPDQQPEGPKDRANMDGSQGVLLPKGHLVMKLLQGAGSQEFAQQLRQHFNKVAWARPAATRSESREVYLLGLGRK
ncbi:hypothetical protein ABBQ38_013824 [Trebouxia sp. C0009 RCD-2024]